MTDDVRLRSLIQTAPQSLSDLMHLLWEGLGWPLYDTALEPEEVLIDWSPEELHLDPDHVARLSRISQIPPLTAKQDFGTFYLQFEGGQLPIGAVRRLVQRLITSRRGKAGGKTPTWNLHDILFFCLADGDEAVLHVVNFQERNGKRLLRVLSWNDNPTEARLSLLAQRALSELTWVEEEGPRLIVEPDQAAGFAAYREGIRNAKALSTRMAEVAQDVRDEVKSLLAVETESGPMKSLYHDVKERLIGDITEVRFADVYAQTMVYGLLTASIAHPEDFKTERSLSVMKFDNEFLDAIYSRFRDEADGLLDVDELGLSDLTEQLATTDVDELLADFGADNQRDDPVVYFYEEFLAQYDPDQRRDLGAFYTPKPVVRYIVKTVDDALKSFGLPLGVADPTTWADYVRVHPDTEIPVNVSPSDAVVSMFDPANGTGTFLVEWLEQAKKNAGPGAVEAALKHASAVEISLASYAVSHLKVSLDLPEGLREQSRLPIFLGDTLGARRAGGLVSLDDPIGAEGRLADQVKFDRHHNVLIGNPPWDRVESEGTGGFITSKTRGTTATGFRSLFDDIFDDAKQNTIFSHHASLYNLYAYFWRLAIWKVFEENTGPAVVSMITASSWLTGPGWLGLRRLAREVADEIIVLDLHGDGQGTLRDENVFDITSPNAIVTLVRRGRGDRSTPAAVRYASFWGTRSDKLAKLSSLATGDTALETEDAGSDWHAPLVPPTGGAEWLAFPALVDLLPWQIAGCKFSRTWPNNPSAEVLRQRWMSLVGTSDLTERAKAFSTKPTGRNIFTRVSGTKRLADLGSDAEIPAIERYQYRSFDRQWALADPRVAELERPSLWESVSNRQVFLATLASYAVGPGPALTASTAVPDMAVYRGSFGGKDVLPLYRDAKGTPNADPALLENVTIAHRMIVPESPEVAPERLFAYIYGVLAGTDYTGRFKEALATPGARVPLSADPELFAAMADHGEHLLWLQTFGERFVAGRSELPVPAARWQPEPTRPPADRSEIKYDAAKRELRVADGLLAGLAPEIWKYEVTGMEIIPKWLGYRMLKPGGRAASSKSPLDFIRSDVWPTEWSAELLEIVTVLGETIRLQPVGVELLNEVLGGPLIDASDLPQPPAWMRQPPTKVDGNALF
ncbi:type ISP restriction/modification enzyme [Curtobacterium sp. SORGH_AS_0776]|uniref:type ISP restriction/modification enzyme n=1 Tax=Curtobacterium sp. SORGH_AS_0776 TaxID=3041798 RepID=UPI0028673BFF|nr:type ISP restriction/modification enzyme [Curtobacterium sp. SORGH_AS_0776]MDR6171155.1 hypothetical protein [Curtobacterium sp. SORGH_AS_0776]